MSKYLPEFMKQKPVDMMGDYTKSYGVKTRFGMLGPVASGKSTIAAGIVHTCEVMSSILTNFYCRVLPTSTHILSDANNLCLGKFPEKTDPFLPRVPEAGLLICERGSGMNLWREKKTQVPICDVAGEITDYIQMKASGFTPGQTIEQRVQSINTEVVKAVRDCQGFITTLSAPDALMFRTAPSKLDPDVYTYTVLNEIFDYRRRNKRPDPQIIVVLTKWDQVIKKAKDIDMDIYNESQQGLAKFLANGFPSTNMLLKPLVDKGNVKFFRSWFGIKKHEDGNEVVWEDTKQPVIDVFEDPESWIRFRPRYAEQDYIGIVRHIGSFGQ